MISPPSQNASFYERVFIHILWECYDNVPAKAPCGIVRDGEAGKFQAATYILWTAITSACLHDEARVKTTSKKTNRLPFVPLCDVISCNVIIMIVKKASWKESAGNTFDASVCETQRISNCMCYVLLSGHGLNIVSLIVFNIYTWHICSNNDTFKSNQDVILTKMI